MPWMSPPWRPASSSPRLRLVAVARHVVVGRVAVGEAVGHQVQDHVRRIEAAALRRARRARAQLERRVEALVAVAEHDVDAARRGIGRDAQVDEQVVRIGHARHRLDAHAAGGRVADLRRGVGDARAVHQQLQLVALHADPPERGLDALDLRGHGERVGRVVGAGRRRRASWRRCRTAAESLRGWCMERLPGGCLSARRRRRRCVREA